MKTLTLAIFVVCFMTMTIGTASAKPNAQVGDTITSDLCEFWLNETTCTTQALENRMAETWEKLLFTQELGGENTMVAWGESGEFNMITVTQAKQALHFHFGRLTAHKPDAYLYERDRRVAAVSASQVGD